MIKKSAKYYFDIEKVYFSCKTKKNTILLKKKGLLTF